MSAESYLLRGAPVSLKTCPTCGHPFAPFLRGVVQRSRRVLWVLWRRPYCALICQVCKEVVGWEDPPAPVPPRPRDPWDDVYRS